MIGFFVPGTVDDEEAEARYAELAAWAGTEVVEPGRRVMTLHFGRGAEEWTATVGKLLSGELAARTDRRTIRRTPIARSAPTRRVSDAATVQAIFEREDSYVVVTDGHPVGSVVDSTWDNPVEIPRGEARRAVRFSP